MANCCDQCVRPVGWGCDRDGEFNCYQRVGKTEILENSLLDICSWCGGYCCIHDQITARISADYLANYILDYSHGYCPAHNIKTGCALSREARPLQCLKYQCRLLTFMVNNKDIWTYCKIYGRLVVLSSYYCIVHCYSCPNMENCNYRPRIKHEGVRPG